MFLIFDTETTGLPKNYKAPLSDSDNWPRLVQLAWQLHDDKGNLIFAKNYIVKPEGFTIPYNSEKIHGISTQRALEEGHDLKEVLEIFKGDTTDNVYLVGHNVEFDIAIVGAEYWRVDGKTDLDQQKSIDTKLVSTNFCQISGGRAGKYKWPTLMELHTKLFGKSFADAHDAAYDVDATAKCFFGLLKHNIGVPPEIEDVSIIAYEAPKLEDANFITKKEEKKTIDIAPKKVMVDDDVLFTHFHNHTQFSILQSTTKIKALVDKAITEGMPGVVMTDTSNLMGAFHFVKEVLGHNKNMDSLASDTDDAEEIESYKNKKLTPVLGCEFNICVNHEDKSKKDNGQQMVLLAKNKKGYQNLIKLSSIAHINGFYYIPRVDKTLIEKYKGDLIVVTGGLLGEIPNLILNVGETQAEEAFLWWKEQFGDDFYVELNRHGLDEENKVNEVLIGFCKKHNVKYFAANNTFYLDKADANAHDILLCVKEGQKKETPIGRGRGYRFGFPNDEFYFKSSLEMKTLFSDLPEAIQTTNEILSKIEPYPLAREVLLPKFGIPQQFTHPGDEKDGGKRGENAYLKHITYEGAKKRYQEITPEIKERLDFELMTIENTGYPGYFLIVEDFIRVARKMGVSVGPGRGSAAGSAVAYCTNITNIDPIKYDLLFERFLNPDRVSLPDIDIDFDDEGRGKVIDYVINKYGASQVAQIVTYGSMAAKSSIRDTARVLDLPLSEADRIAKLVPDMKLNKMFAASDEYLKDKLKPEQVLMAEELKAISRGTDLAAQTVQQALILEGSLRNTGIHACGVIITPDDITKFVPVASAKDSDLWVTQFDNSVVEDAGLLKMDFLGLKTLTLIKDAVKIIKAKYGIEIIPDDIPLDDPLTYELFQKGETVGVFQYESEGMQENLKALKPDKFADLIAMNALYRPGPIQYIPNFIKRKNGLEEIVYDLPEMEDHLAETYGITVYQEQVMLLSQKLAGFSKGDADVLRKAMGKKVFALLTKLKPQFIEGAMANGHPKDVLNKIWADWEAFAAYAFNKSHATCYAYIAFHTAYLKANYPAEYMASVLSNNMNDIKSVTFFMEECRRMGLTVLGPDINESFYKFAVNNKGEVRFGLGAIKGVGEGAVEAIVNERKKNGLYTSVFDALKRIDIKAANKRTMEGLVLSGGLDSFGGTHRAQYMQPNEKGATYLEQIIKFGAAYQASKNAPPDLFGESHAVELSEPTPPTVEPWGSLEALSKEKEVVGIFISGHPLDDYKIEIDNFTRGNLSHLQNLESIKNKELALACIVIDVEHRMTKKGKPFGVLEVEDYTDSHKFFLFQEDYLKMRHFFVPGNFLFIKGRVQEKRWTKNEELEFNIGTIELLSDVKEKLTKSLTLKLPLDLVKDDFINELQELLEQYKGNCSVLFEIVHEIEKISVRMPAKTTRVEVNEDLFKELAQFQIKYKLN